MEVNESDDDDQSLPPLELSAITKAILDEQETNLRSATVPATWQRETKTIDAYSSGALPRRSVTIASSNPIRSLTSPKSLSSRPYKSGNDTDLPHAVDESPSAVGVQSAMRPSQHSYRRQSPALSDVMLSRRSAGQESSPLWEKVGSRGSIAQTPYDADHSTEQKATPRNSNSASRERSLPRSHHTESTYGDQQVERPRDRLNMPSQTPIKLSESQQKRASPDVFAAEIKNPILAHLQEKHTAPQPANSSKQPGSFPSILAVDRSGETSKPKHSRRVVINDKSYTILRQLGKGGSGRVYEIAGPHNSLRAFKSIPLRGLDEQSKKKIENEVALLQSLHKVGRVVRLDEWSINEAKKQLHLVMELGQRDLNSMIQEQLERNPQLDLAFTGFYWHELLQCVAAIHELDIVHSDLKPANFVLVKGILKLVDFGIANAIPDDTVNVYKEHLDGTPNYMAPETLSAMASTPHPQESRTYRFGKPSDVWSLGCILYQLIYGKSPFGHIPGLGPKVMAISDPRHLIEFPKQGLGGVVVPQSYIQTMKACLSRQINTRPTVRQLLQLPSGQLGAHHSRGPGDVYVTQKSMEAAFADALRDAGVPQLPGDLEGWASEIMEALEKHNG